jgi:hypothetical protein
MTTTRSPLLTRTANILAATIIAVIPFHAFLTVWLSSLVGQYTLLRLWDELLLLVLLAIVSWWVVHEADLRRWLFGSLLVRLIGLYVLLHVLLGTVALAKGTVSLEALGYGLVVNLRYLLFFVAVLVTAQRSGWLALRWPRLLLVPAAVVSLFAVLQYTVLPHNFLVHFGYNEATTIAPIETINNNAEYVRVQSTLRGANPLGAYLGVILAAVASLWALKRRRLWLGGVGLLSLLALVFSFSRSAWIGAVVAVAVAVGLQLQTGRAKRAYAVVGLSLALVCTALFLAFQNQSALQNAVFHTDDESKVSVSSNEARASAITGGLQDALEEPFGRGPGTAGPASVHNTDQEVRLAENYYVQIAQETGWAGLVLFLVILALVAHELYIRRKGSPLAIALLASLVGLCTVNLLSHAWTDDTLAYVWWGLAGVALALPPAAAKAKRA